MTVTEKENAVIIEDFGGINLDLTLDCGQAFRWRKDENGLWCGTAYGKSIKITGSEEKLIICNSNIDDVKKIWIEYFDLNRDYGKILETFKNDEFVCSSIEKCGTIRILNQEPWEALCSFIISACNNIPRIKGIVERMCEEFGEKLEDGSFAFPSPEIIAGKTDEDLSVLRAGYRVPFILDAARSVANGNTDFSVIRTLEENEARKKLEEIKGVGKKVADCTLLFSLGFSSVFPVDRHISRALAELYPDGLPECFGAFSGLAQQYIFNEQRLSSQK